MTNKNIGSFIEGFSEEDLAMLITAERTEMLPENELRELPMVSACGDCNTYKNPKTGEFEKEYIPKGKAGFDYQLSHGICNECTSNYNRGGKYKL